MAVVSAPDQEQLNDLQLYRVKDAMRLLNLSRTVIYEQLRQDGSGQSSKAGPG
jgi:hypothetical protein